jgi:hypothetical protein
MHERTDGQQTLEAKAGWLGLELCTCTAAQQHVRLVMLLRQAAVPKLLLAGSLCGSKGWQQYAESTL